MSQSFSTAKAKETPGAGRKRRFDLVIVHTVVMTFLFQASGAYGLSQIQLATVAPALVAEQLANDSRARLTPEGRKKLRAAAAQERRNEAGRQASLKPQRDFKWHPQREAVIDLKALADELTVLQQRLAADTSQAIDTQASARLRAAELRIAAAHKQIVAGFTDFARLASDENIDASVVKRQAGHEKSYYEAHDKLLLALQEARTSNDSEARKVALQTVVALLSATHDNRRHQKFDPNAMPFAVNNTKVRAPRMDWQLEKAERIAEKPDSARPATQARAAAPEPADLEPNIDVQITAEIDALAASLNNDPVAIYDWVYNNISYYASYGSVQGSQLTLDMRRGNAHDISALLVALLRSAGVPSRFVNGTISVATADALNWMFGAADADFAQQVMGQGGIPNIAITNGQQVVSFQMEHVWVSAYVDYIPSRGALNVTGDTWVDLDAAYKRHSFTAPSGVQAAVPIAPVLQEYEDDLLVNEALGQVRSPTGGPPPSSLPQYATDAMNYLTTNGFELDSAAILGTTEIIQKTSKYLDGTTPYEVMSASPAVATLPSAQRYAVRVSGYRTSQDRSFGFTDFTHLVTLPELNSQRLGLQFDPATQADADIIQAAIDNNAASLPVASVNLTPKLKIDGQVVGTGTTLGMGRDYFIDLVLTGPVGATTVPYDMVAGDDIVLGVTGNGFNAGALQKRLDNNTVDNTAEYFHQVSMHYWVGVDELSTATAAGYSGYYVRLPSIGLFASPLTVSYVFGNPNTGVYASRFMDVKRSFIGAAAPTAQERINLVKTAGLNGSWMEGTTFDQFQNDPVDSGVDAVKLLGAAYTRGIPVYRITQANQAAALPLLNLSSAVEQDISLALAAGKTVFAPEQAVNIETYSGTGYILVDEATGEGAYLISGGLAGGGIWECIELIVTIVAFIILIIILAYLAYLAVLALAGFLAGLGLAEAFASLLLLIGGLGATA